MSPELFDPESFGLKADCPTKRSDCYALGMLIYEVLSGEVPFSQYRRYPVVVKILRGERPGRPRGVIGRWFTNEVWGVLECCWRHTPRDRPGIGDVLQCLENVSRSWTPSSQTVPVPQPTNPSTGDLEPSSEEPTGDSEFPSPLQGDSRSLRKQSKGDPDENDVWLSAHEFLAFHCDPCPPQSRMSAKNPDRSDSEESIETLERVSWVGFTPQPLALS